MSFSHFYHVPAYFPDFHCKAGDCRHPCCSGWCIAISMQEYFRMISLDCSPELRHRLDTAFHLSEDPSEEHYAMISPRWDGDCPLHLPNGYCGLQCECGEEAIPSVCRYYPRSPKSRYAYQCYCSNSCEAVVEQLFAYQEPMTFLKQRLTFHISEEIPHQQDALSHLFPAIQRACLHILQNRTYSLAQRLLHLGDFVCILNIPYRKNHTPGMRAVLPFATTADASDHLPETPPLSDRELLRVLTYLHSVLCWIEENNPQLCDEAKAARELLAMPADGTPDPITATRWHTHTAHLTRLFPDNERMLEQIFVNHLCYNTYPFASERQNMWDDHIAFCTAYALVRILSVCHLAICNKTDSNQATAAYADIVAAAFRLIEHTNFVHNANVLAHRGNFTEVEAVALLCRL